MDEEESCEIIPDLINQFCINRLTSTSKIDHKHRRKKQN